MVPLRDETAPLDTTPEKHGPLAEPFSRPREIDRDSPYEICALWAEKSTFIRERP
jgi:hypothetical protein